MIPEAILRSVSKPGRYTGGEYGQIIKDKEKVKARFAFCFPDSYEIGMSNLGIRILYGVLNREEDIWCERVYAPWVDMEEKMREFKIPLWAHESGDPIAQFDFVGFTLQYEMSYTNILNMLDLAGIPLRSADRTEDMPLVIGGGPCSYNAEPVADFFDLFNVGEGEEMLPEIVRLYIKMKEDGSYTRRAFLHEAARSIEGVYVPSLYDVTYNDDGTVKAYTPKYPDVPKTVRKRIVKDLDTMFFPDKLVMPYLETIQDRIMLEVFRGCIRGCRFCQAGIIYRPVREKSPEVLCKQAKCLYEYTGYEEISLSSLSISDYTRLRELTDGLISWTDDKKVSLSLPSLRIDSFTRELMDKVASVRASSITFAPEAGTQRLRDVINKNVTEENLMNAAGIAFSAGKDQVKLYFMDGLPTETEDDLAGIAALGKAVIEKYYATPERNKRRQPQVTVSVSCFVPKPFTPFQWEKQITPEEYLRRARLLKDNMPSKSIEYNWHAADLSRLEAVLARGDRRLGPVLEEAVRRGARLDGWDEYFSYQTWLDAFAACGVDPEFYTTRGFGLDELLPWDTISDGVSTGCLLRERERAYRSETTPDCRTACNGCGANRLLKGGRCDA